MDNFRIASQLLNNPVEFPLDDEWLGLLRAEFEAHEADTQYLFDEFYRLLALEQPPESVFQSECIEQRPGGTYRVTIQVEGVRVRQLFNTLDEARLYRNQMLNHPPVGGAMAQAFLASLNDERNLLTAA